MADKRLLAAGALGVAAIAVGGVVATSGGGKDEAAPASQAGATATIRRQDLIESDSVAGTLGYSDTRAVINRLAGTVTWTPKVGSVVRTNQRLFTVDGKAVYLLDGTYPAYRTLHSGLSGDDVRQFERNMRRLGHDPARAMTVDGSWDAGTTAAAKRWQHSKGLREDGSIEKGRIVFQPGARRVSDVKLAAGASASGGGGGGGANSPAAHRGAATTTPAVYGEGGAAGSMRFVSAPADSSTPTTTTPTRPLTATTPTAPAAPAAPATTTPTQPKSQPQAEKQPTARGGSGGDQPTGGADVSTELMTTTSTKRIVAVDLETTKQALARKGATVVVELPDGRTVRGTLVSIGKVAEKKATTQNEDPPATVKLVIKLRGSTGTGLDQAPVEVRLERRRAKDALAVPVTALLARAGGELAVEVRDGGSRRVVPVMTGIYTDGYVEIDGKGLRPGLTVTDSGI